MSDEGSNDDPYELARFVAAQEGEYVEALAELRRGAKHGHWIWFIFPQVAGLGSSPMAERYAIRSAREARAYLQHPVLGPRLTECADALLSVEGKSIDEIMGFPDDLKLRSSMTLFEAVSAAGSPFHAVLERYFAGESDGRTTEYLAAHEAE
ncbi:MAG: DUF1810 domain-containing protein [Verrucomicrobia bacterium]|nr:DUF1810 domain-containing protein [Verrucomicrobiota bacterium]